MSGIRHVPRHSIIPKTEFDRIDIFAGI